LPINNKNIGAHEKVLNKCKNISEKTTGRKIVFKEVICDYELGLMNAVKRVFNNDTQACYIHFSQAL